MLFSIYTVSIIISAFLLAWVGSHASIHLLSAAKVFDTPNERSNHETPVPRGAGIAVIITSIMFLFVGGVHSTILLAAIGVATVSFLDDTKGVDIKLRLLIHFLAVLLLFLPGGVVETTFENLIFQGLLPPILDRVLAGILLLGFMNLFNFMDGIDGISGAETIAIGAGLFAISLFVPNINLLGLDGLVLAAAGAGFLLLNWHPAKIFLGDVGSITLGFLLGFLLLSLAAKGYWASALMLPAYYLIDGGLTFIKRLIKKERVWEAHSNHAYQKAVRSGYSHSYVVKKISIANALLIILAILSAYAPNIGVYLLIPAYVGTFFLQNFLLTSKPAAEQTIIEPIKKK